MIDIDRRRAEQYPERTMSFDQIRKSLPVKPVSTFSVFSTKISRRGFLPVSYY